MSAHNDQRIPRMIIKRETKLPRNDKDQTQPIEVEVQQTNIKQRRQLSGRNFYIFGTKIQEGGLLNLRDEEGGLLNNQSL
jgi:hypothetical protein